ncbi:hypothetical protein PR048_026756 [Dryococelus australis]|uniref:Uncharacterized protein n=1 Tax=Dryococelus australis TaxID=614101 RepID=A0ABQ9GM81_9NEOP|nr:hypothetical protein PR048_026756 [Dryococelus australis]
MRYTKQIAAALEMWSSAAEFRHSHVECRASSLSIRPNSSNPSRNDAESWSILLDQCVWYLYGNWCKIIAANSSSLIAVASEKCGITENGLCPLGRRLAPTGGTMCQASSYRKKLSHAAYRVVFAVSYWSELCDSGIRNKERRDSVITHHTRDLEDTGSIPCRTIWISVSRIVFRNPPGERWGGFLLLSVDLQRPVASVRRTSVNRVTNSQSEVAITSIRPSENTWEALTFEGQRMKLWPSKLAQFCHSFIPTIRHCGAIMSVQHIASGVTQFMNTKRANHVIVVRNQTAIKMFSSLSFLCIVICHPGTESLVQALTRSESDSDNGVSRAERGGHAAAPDFKGERNERSPIFRNDPPHAKIQECRGSPLLGGNGDLDCVSELCAGYLGAGRIVCAGRELMDVRVSHVHDMKTHALSSTICVFIATLDTGTFLAVAKHRAVPWPSKHSVGPLEAVRSLLLIIAVRFLCPTCARAKVISHSVRQNAGSYLLFVTSTLSLPRQIWAALNSEVLRADEGEVRWVWDSIGMKGRGKRRIPEKTR